ncbi:MAG TPA: ROK family protein [Noviherbaspirillum sp.]|uniref:ROK family protein n=1 Tax=Noviherbaspirillum sp. TaxID=1926288 RepID=UPI002D510E83|nr:ROK family protein [Noviherbaspirillum sp.]HYD95845.1 ROK family protein [Noviherbaspirillum sp.]
MNTEFIAALDIGGTKMAATVAGPDGPLVRLSQPVVKTGPVRALPEQALALIDAACAQAGIEPDAVAAVGVASCGPFVLEDEMIALAAPNLCGARALAADLPNDWETIPLEQVLRERFDKVAIENDCVAALAAELGFGAVIGETDCVYVTWSTGVGFGLCVDGRILRGKNGNAGHAGHMLLSDNGEAVCGCGNRGDVEALASGRNIGNRLGKPASELFRAAREGDQAAREAALQAARWFGRGLYNVVAALDTRVFVIGGSVWQHHGDWLAPVVLEEITSRLPALTAGVKILPAALGPLVADVGALALVVPPAWGEEWRRTAPWQKLAG